MLEEIVLWYPLPLFFCVSQLLFPGGVGILTMSEVVVATVNAAILIPEKSLLLMRWVSAIPILLVGLIEVLPGNQ